jgi:cytochrome c551/c552
MHLPKLRILSIFAVFSLVACGSEEPVAPESLLPPENTSNELSANIQATGEASAAHTQAAIDQYCVVCHNEQLETAGLRLDNLVVADVASHSAVLEKVVRKLRTGTMPPVGMPAPAAEDRRAIIGWLEYSLDEVATVSPNPGRTETLRRLNRTEYQNAIRDLLALEIDAGSLLPPDESGYGFDNVNVGDLPPALLDRYISAAQKIARLAVGGSGDSVQSEVINVPPDLTQEEHISGLPIGTRGGISVSYTFPQNGEYDIQVRLARNRTGNIGGLRNAQEQPLELLVDREIAETFMVVPPEGIDHSEVDKNFIARVPLAAGPHDLGVTFPKIAASLIESERQPLQSHFNETRHPRLNPAVFQISITGPYNAEGAGDTPSRQRIFSCQPSNDSEEVACATEILSAITRRAYRRPVSDDDVARPLEFFQSSRVDSTFEEAVGAALGAILMNPNFLFRVEIAPAEIESGSVYKINEFELASRLSFFLWSSLPDDQLLDLAEQGVLSNDEILEQQVQRMLADSRSKNLATNFAGQWLQLRNLEAFSPNVRDYPDFDDNLRQAFRTETELFLDSVLQEDRSIIDLLQADYTFLNERLAKHYGISGVYGSRFRRVQLGENSDRGGLLRHGSVLSVTSFANRTSPVLRGVWVLDNIYGAPPPPPPPNVPALDETAVASALPMRERLAQHRNNPVCASCHNTIDPVGFSLENFDAVGRWRDNEGDNPVDVAGGLPGMEPFTGVAGLETGLLTRPELIADTITEKLMTFALGRGVEYFDAPAIRKIVREAEAENYRLSSLVLGIVQSTPFQIRISL